MEGGQEELTWEMWFKITNALQDETWHVILSVISGVLAYLLIVTIFYVVFWFIRRISHLNVSLDTGPKRFIHLMGLFYGLWAVWLSHMLLDWFTTLYNMPLGPHLPLILH